MVSDLAALLVMLVRGRGASDVPARMAEKMLQLGGVSVPGEGETRENRLEALGALLGMTMGHRGRCGSLGVGCFRTPAAGRGVGVGWGSGDGRRRRAHGADRGL